MNQCEKEIIRWIYAQDDLWPEFENMNEVISEFYTDREGFRNSNGDKYLELKSNDLEQYVREYSGYIDEFLDAVDFQAITNFIASLSLSKFELKPILAERNHIQSIGDKQIISIRKKINGTESVQVVGQVLPEPVGEEPGLEHEKETFKMLEEISDTAFERARLESKLMRIKNDLIKHEVSNGRH